MLRLPVLGGLFVALAVATTLSPVVGAEPASRDGGSPGKLIVVGAPYNANCKCEYDVQFAVGAGNAGCVTVALVVNPHTPAPECEILEVCTSPNPCKGSFTVRISINNWAQCCPGALNNMGVCLNGSGTQLIPHGFGGDTTLNITGTKLVCQANSDSSDTDTKTDTVSVVCGGTGCGGGNPGALMWTAEYTEYGYHCPAGDA